jgi:hypothetical protein
LVDFQCLDGVAGSEQGSGEGPKAGTDLLHRIRSRRTNGLGDLGSKGGLGEKVLP